MNSQDYYSLFQKKVTKENELEINRLIEEINRLLKKIPVLYPNIEILNNIIQTSTALDDKAKAALEGLKETVTHMIDYSTKIGLKSVVVYYDVGGV